MRHGVILTIMKTCTIPNCGNRLYARTWCSAHYKRWLKTGDVRASEPIGRYSPEQVERAASKIRGRKYGKRPEEWGQNISAAKKGKSNGREGFVLTAETRQKIGEANSGERAGTWKGDDAGYVAIHERARKTIARQCLHCGSEHRIQASLRRDAIGPIKVAVMHISGKDREIRYSTNTDDYMALCIKCHKKYDAA